MHAFVRALVFLLSAWRNHVAMTIMAMTVAGGDGAYTDDVGGKLRCRIIIMPAFFALASMPCEVANARQA